MLRTGALFLWLALFCGKAFAGIDVELDIVFNDSLRRVDGSAVQCRFMYVICPATDGANDTLAIFDTLSFDRKNRVSLFYSIPSDGKNKLVVIDSDGLHVESNLFRISTHRTTFAVTIDGRKIEVVGKDYLYLRKNESEQSYYAFLLIFFVVKFLITFIFVSLSKLPWRVISIASGAFLLSAFIDWLFPLNYLYRLLITMLAEYLLIALIGRKSISWLKTAMLVLVVNLAGVGFIFLLYLMFVFW